MSKIMIALDILTRLWMDGKISTSEYDDRNLAICVWAKRRILRKVCNV